MAKKITLNNLARFLTKLKETFVLSKDLSTVAKTGSYNDLSNKPTIPVITVTENSDGTVDISIT